MSFADKIIKFNNALRLSADLPPGVEVMNPFRDKTTAELSASFYEKFYSDDFPRTLIMGINPGRFGGGITGVPFTDPIILEVICGIENNLPKKAELSANFIYKMIETYGGCQPFYQKFYISAVSPLGFTKDGRNVNYYDSKELQASIMDFIIHCLEQQLNFGVNKKVCYCLGEGENSKFLSKLNQQYHFFNQIISLPHPRFILQYRRKLLDEYVKLYVDTLSETNSNSPFFDPLV